MPLGKRCAYQFTLALALSNIVIDRSKVPAIIYFFCKSGYTIRMRSVIREIYQLVRVVMQVI